MKDVRFYEEFWDKKTRRIPQCNVIAVDKETTPFRSSTGTWCINAIAAIFPQADSPVATTDVALSYLHGNCKLVSEGRARQIHPALFLRLDN